MFEKKILKFVTMSAGAMVILALTAIAAFACPIVNCSIDGQMMMQEGCTYTNGTVCKFGHDTIESDYQGMHRVHHYVYVRCN